MNETVHCDHVVELAERRIKHVAGTERWPNPTRRTPAHVRVRKADERRRNVDADDIGAAFGEFERERARPAARIKNAATCRCVGRPAEKSSRAFLRARRGPSPGRGLAARPMSCASTSRPQSGRNSARVVALGKICRAGHQSNQGIEEVAVLHRLGRKRLDAIPQPLGKERYSFFTASSSGDVSISNRVDF